MTEDREVAKVLEVIGSEYPDHEFWWTCNKGHPTRTKTTRSLREVRGRARAHHDMDCRAGVPSIWARRLVWANKPRSSRRQTTHHGFEIERMDLSKSKLFIRLDRNGREA